MAGTDGRSPGRLVSLAAFLAAAGLGAATAGAGTGRHAPQGVATLAATLLLALSFHLLLSLPEGQLVADAAAWPWVWSTQWRSASASASSLPPGRYARPRWRSRVHSPRSSRCLRSSGATRLRSGPHATRLLWLAAGALVGAEIALVCGVLNLLVDWPIAVAAITIAASATLPLSLVAGASARPAPGVDRVLVNVADHLRLHGRRVRRLPVRRPRPWQGTGGDGGATVARAVDGGSGPRGCAVRSGPPPVARLGHPLGLRSPRRLPMRCSGHSGRRLTRAIPMDELLLQLAESLRKTMGLTSAEVYTGTGDVLELAASVPDVGARAVTVTQRERPVVSRAGVSGGAWASIWIPPLVEGRRGVPLRVAPICHAGELLGLIVVERPSGSDAFSEDDDRVLPDLARQVGLAFHNAQLDSALQTTLDELRRQADELRASRARVVASGDAERRRVERDLHDGAQQHLVALAINLRMARDLVDEDPVAASEMLAELGGAVQDTIQRAARARPRHLPPAAGRRRVARRAPGGGRSNPLPARWRRTPSGGTPATWRRRSTSVASRRCRTPASTPPRLTSRSGCGRRRAASSSR